MVDKSFQLNEWKLDLDIESLMDYTGCKDLGLIVKGIYISEVALAVHLSWERGVSETNRTKECLGRLLRFLSSYAEELELVVPVLCLIHVPEGVDAEIKNKLNQWAADQDWHRGDFSIVVLSEDKDKNKDVEDIIRKILGTASTAWPQIELKPRDIKAIINSFQSEMRSRRISEEHASLLAAIAQTLDEGTDKPIQNWLNGRMEDIYKLMEGRKGSER
ncbi:hypothetical protein [Caldanaerobius polysaccharolyticus]|uniref:hypothetical protein n=1 Tax=Caldanaerobius polysaccharolyticus TaxID=44256 RepID=UPI00047CECE7|nr:hypothetical protein [Caldanaerobius polysaccharolyticus]